VTARVVDTSVLAAFVFKEERADEAGLFLDGGELFAPPLLAYELAGVASKKVRRAGEREGAVADALQIALSMGIQWVEPDHEAALRLALETGLTTYDACYLLVAWLLEADLVTFDERLGEAARRRLR